MSDRQGYYSVIQYSPVPDRFEFVNIGVVLFSPQGQRVFVKIEPDYKRIKKVFGEQDKHHIRMMKESIQNRLYSEFPSGWAQKSIVRFVDLRSGMVQMSRPLPFLVKDAEADLAGLFDEMVHQSEKNPRSSPAVSLLRKRLNDAGVLDLVQQQPEAIQLPQAVEIKTPFGYQNGSYNFIDPVRLEGDTKDALREASIRAIKGQWLDSAFASSPRKKKLIVVGDLSDQPSAFASAIHDLMFSHKVSFFDMDQLEPLIDDIRKSAQAHGVAISSQ